MPGLMFPITLMYGSALGLIYLVVSYRVSRARMQEKVSLGDGGNEKVLLAYRVQANMGEYVPLTLILVAGLEASPAPALIVHILGGALVAGRVLHAVGLSQGPKPNFGRVSGTLITWIVLLIASVAGLYYALMS